MGRSYYDENYGHYEVHDQDDVDFYFQTQRQSRRKKCQGCGRMVRIKPEYAYCNSCADRIERGGDL